MEEINIMKIIGNYETHGEVLGVSLEDAGEESVNWKILILIG